MEIPLLGVPAETTLEECDCCHDLFPLVEMTLTGPQFLCFTCNNDERT